MLETVSKLTDVVVPKQRNKVNPMSVYKYECFVITVDLFRSNSGRIGLLFTVMLICRDRTSSCCFKLITCVEDENMI